MVQTECSVAPEKTVIRECDNKKSNHTTRTQDENTASEHGVRCIGQNTESEQNVSRLEGRNI